MNKQETSRSQTITALEKGVDILVIGGGINGAGIFRDAALRGLSVGLIEMNDFGSGTSSRSSKLIHGGVRYLEHLDLGLVMESSLERTRLSNLLPDLVKPVPFILPVYQDSPHGLFTMDLGLWIYDALALFRNTRLHRRLSKKETLRQLPALKSEGLVGSVRYYDCRVNDSRLVINNIISGCAAGGLAMNYTEAIDVKKEAGRITGVVMRDRLMGKTAFLPCKKLVSATGPWTNGFYHKLEGAEKEILRLTKGIHLLFPRERFKTEAAAVITSKDDRRIIFIIPWEEYTLVGTTDTDFNGDLNHVYPDKSDVSYLLNLVNGFFPGLTLKPGDALSAFAGLRPLVLAGGNASAVSRKDKILRTKSGALLIGGGKLTTYRHIAQKTVDRLVKELGGNSRRKPGPCKTTTEPLIDKPELSYDTEETRLDRDILNYLFARYGKGAFSIIETAGQTPQLSERLAPGLPFIFAEIPYGVRHEMLLSITDFFRLRTEIFLKTPDNGLAHLDHAVELLGAALSLSVPEKQAQADEYRTFVKQNLDCLNKNAEI